MQDNVWYLCFESCFQLYKKVQFGQSVPFIKKNSNIWELDPQGNLLSGGTCSYSPLEIVPQKKLIPFSLRKLLFRGTWLVLPFCFFLLEQNPLLLWENSLFIEQSCLLGQFNPLLLQKNYLPNQFNFLLPKGNCSFSP